MKHFKKLMELLLGPISASINFFFHFPLGMFYLFNRITILENTFEDVLFEISAFLSIIGSLTGCWALWTIFLSGYSFLFREEDKSNEYIAYLILGILGSVFIIFLIFLGLFDDPYSLKKMTFIDYVNFHMFVVCSPIVVGVLHCINIIKYKKING